MKILPTHQCFDDSLDYLVYRLRHDPRCAERLRLVHGIALFPVDQLRAGERFAHGWVEEHGTALGVLVWDAGLLNGQRVLWSAKRSEYYKHMRVEVTTTYTVDQAYELNAQHVNFGPWESSYRALCRDRQPTMTTRLPRFGGGRRSAAR